MPKPSRTRKRRPTLAKDPSAFPILMALVAAVMVFGAFQYSLMVALSAAIFVGFFAWRWWQRAAKGGAKK